MLILTTSQALDAYSSGSAGATDPSKCPTIKGVFAAGEVQVRRAVWKCQGVKTCDHFDLLDDGFERGERDVRPWQELWKQRLEANQGEAQNIYGFSSRCVLYNCLLIENVYLLLFLRKVLSSCDDISMSLS